MNDTLFLQRDENGAWSRVAESAAGPDDLRAEVVRLHPLVGGKMVAARNVLLAVEPESPADTEYWLAVCPSLNFITTQGESRQEAIANAQDMLSLYLEEALENGELVPATDVPREVAAA